MDFAELWVKVAEEKLELDNDTEAHILMNNLKEEISGFRITKDELDLTENLCRKVETKGPDENFRSSLTYCRYVVEGGIPFSLRKLEELSVEPVVYIIHDFLSDKEAEECYEDSQEYTYTSNNADNIGESVEEENVVDVLGQNLGDRYENGLKLNQSFHIGLRFITYGNLIVKNFNKNKESM